jgi:DNA-directed RNA polymerase specialized sigma subunit
MTSKEYLLQARFLDASIRTKVEQIEALNDLATSCTAVISDMPRNPNRGGSRMADAVMKIIDLQEEIKNDMIALVNLKREIMDVIKAVSSLELRTILEKRYLSFISWERIAVELGYSIQHTYRLHDAALKEVEEILKHES